MQNEADNMVMNQTFELLINSINIFKQDPIAGLQFCNTGINLMYAHFYNYFSLLEIDEIEESINLLKKHKSQKITINELKRELDNLKTFVNARTVAKQFNT